jgi:hypothetical protein
VRAWDVRGEYAFSYDDQLTVALTTAGSLRQKVAGASDTVVLGGGFTLDLADFCMKQDCPADVLGTRVAIDEVDPEGEAARHVIELNGHGGWVDHSLEDELTATLTGGTCRPLAVVTGRFSHRGETVIVEPLWQNADGGLCDPLDGGTCMLLVAPGGGVSWPGDAPVDGISHGRVGTLFPASCAFPGSDGTLLLSTDFLGSRIGDLETSDAGVTVD